MSLPKAVHLLINNNFFACICQEELLLIEYSNSCPIISAHPEALEGQSSLSMRVIIGVPKIEGSISEYNCEDVAC